MNGKWIFRLEEKTKKRKINGGSLPHLFGGVEFLFLFHVFIPIHFHCLEWWRRKTYQFMLDVHRIIPAD